MSEVRAHYLIHIEGLKDHTIGDYNSRQTGLKRTKEPVSRTLECIYLKYQQKKKKRGYVIMTSKKFLRHIYLYVVDGNEL